jgi:hypothetical protein
MRNGSSDVSWQLKLALLLTTVVLTVLGSGLVFASHLTAHLYGTEETLSGTNGARTAGAAIFALGALAWLGTRQELKVLRAVVIPVLFTWFVLKSVVAYLALMAGVFKAPVGRTVLAFDLVLAVVYGYFLFAGVLTCRRCCPAQGPDLPPSPIDASIGQLKDVRGPAENWIVSCKKEGTLDALSATRK